MSHWLRRAFKQMSTHFLITQKGEEAVRTERTMCIIKRQERSVLFGKLTKSKETGGDQSFKHIA
jgi:hypothetical protein